MTDRPQPRDPLFVIMKDMGAAFDRAVVLFGATPGHPFGATSHFLDPGRKAWDDAQGPPVLPAVRFMVRAHSKDGYMWQAVDRQGNLLCESPVVRDTQDKVAADVSQFLEAIFSALRDDDTLDEEHLTSDGILCASEEGKDAQ